MAVEHPGGRLASIRSLQQRAAAVHRAAVELQFQEEERLLADQIRSLQCHIGQLRLLGDEIRAVNRHVEQISLGIDVHTPIIASLRTQTDQVDRLAAAVAGSADVIRQHLASLRSAGLPQAPGPATMDAVPRPGRMRDWTPNLRAALSEVVALDSEPPRDAGATRPMPPPLGALDAIRASLRELRLVALVAPLADDCAICIDDMRPGQLAVTLPCGHAFHCSCILQWLVRGSASCPLCKRSVCCEGIGPSASPFPPLVPASQLPFQSPFSIEPFGSHPALAAAQQPRSSSPGLRTRTRKTQRGVSGGDYAPLAPHASPPPWLASGSVAIDGDVGWSGPVERGSRLTEAVARLRVGHDAVGVANLRRGGIGAAQS